MPQIVNLPVPLAITNLESRIIPAVHTLLIEDEAHNRAYLSQLLRRHCPEISLLGEADRMEEGLAYLAEHRPDLLLLDIKLPDGTGLELLRRLPQLDFELIFITAYDHYALEAIRFCAIDYLLKPVKTPDLIRAVQKAAERVALRQENLRLRQLVENSRLSSAEQRLALPTQQEVLLVPVREVLRCQGESNYTHFYLQNGQRHLVSRTLKEYEELLEPHGFMRIHQSHLVNLGEVSAFGKADGGYVQLSDGTRLPVSRYRKEAVFRRLVRG